MTLLDLSPITLIISPTYEIIYMTHIIIYNNIIDTLIIYILYNNNIILSLYFFGVYIYTRNFIM